MPSFAFRASSHEPVSYFVLLHTAHPPDAAIWSAYVDALRSALAASTGALPIFAVTDGGGPDSNQRRALADVFSTDPHGSVTRVFTTSTITRGIVTAFHWIARARAVAFDPEAFSEECERCHVSESAVLADLMLLQRTLPPVALLAQIKRTVRTRSTQPPRPSRP